jgi:putative ABC transport system permease protein
MGITTVIAESLQSLGKNKARTALSVLGIVIGIAAVIAMVAVATGAQKKVEREIAAIGDDWLVVGYWGMQRAGVRQQGAPPNIAVDDANAVRREIVTARAVSMITRMGAQVVSSYSNYQASVRGVEPSYFDIRRWDVPVGRLMTPEDMGMRAKVCWLGVTPARELFGGVPPIGQIIRINLVAFEVVGLLAPKGVSSDGEDLDNEVLVPFTSFQTMLAGNRPPRAFITAAAPGVTLDLLRSDIRGLLRQRHRLADGEDDGFRMWDRQESAEANTAATQAFNLLLTSIASISLLVGGVGIMNIMLVSVTERTREIGLRMAIGAQSTHILGQFLCEAVVLCSIGGLIGFAAGCGVADFVAWRLGWETEISYWMAAVAIAFATAVGLFFGFYPAWRASRLDPIEALRFE